MTESGIALCRYRPTTKEALALAALKRRPGGMSPLNVGVILAGAEAREAQRETLIKSGNQVLSALARHGLAVRLQPRSLSWPIFKITTEGQVALGSYWSQQQTARAHGSERRGMSPSDQ